MKAPRLAGRLALAAEMVGHTPCLADVGCDHGKLCVYCLSTGLADKAIAIDISAPSLAKAKQLADSVGVSLDARLGDGLTPTVPHEVHTAVIAGMGGMEIARILALAPSAPPALVLVPHHDSDMVARYLHLAQYTIVHDRVVWDDGHWYRVMCAHGGTRTLGAGWQDALEGVPSQGPWYVGEENRTNPAYAAYRRQRLDFLQSIMALGNRNPRVRAEWDELQRIEYEGN